MPQPLILPVFTELQCVLAQLGTCSVPTTLAANTGEAAITRGLPSCTHSSWCFLFHTSSTSFLHRIRAAVPDWLPLCHVFMFPGNCDNRPSGKHRGYLFSTLPILLSDLRTLCCFSSCCCDAERHLARQGMLIHLVKFLLHLVCQSTVEHSSNFLNVRRIQQLLDYLAVLQRLPLTNTGIPYCH